MRNRDQGSYLLIIALKRGREVAVGRLGGIRFPGGYYVYTGSGMKALSARIRRHLRKEGKRLRWHIDYLLSLPGASVVTVLRFPSFLRQECTVNRRVAALPGARLIRRGFGASDCRSGCPSHLFHFGKARPRLQERFCISH